jgi:catechol 2,3-dioxygenase-like lactoylglutathione lyase family enzyme
VNHVCLAFDQATYEALYERLTALGVHATKPTADSFGARGPAVSSFYFGDPDGNVFEARYYAE